MLVQCPSCSARYRVNAANIPSTGGRIRCPSCEHTFIVYPESAPPTSDTSSAHGYDEAKTSTADVQRLMMGARALQQSPTAEQESGPTEIMSGDSLPNFTSLFGGNEPAMEDGTVEMQNPMAFLKAAGWAGTQDEDEPEEATQIVSTNMVFASGTDPLAAVQSAPGAQSRLGQSEHMSPDLGSNYPNHGSSSHGSSSDVDAMFGSESNPIAFHPTREVIPPSLDSLPATQGAAVHQATVQVAPASQGSLEPGYQGPWKLKTNFGLTYEFQDIASLKSWMSSRDELLGYTLAGDDGVFRDLAIYPQLGAKATPATQLMHAVHQQPVQPQHVPLPGVPATEAGLSGHDSYVFQDDPLAGFSTPPEQVRTLGPKVGDSSYTSSSKNRVMTFILMFLFLVFGLAVVALSLHIFKVLDFRELLDLNPPAVAVKKAPSQKKIAPKKEAPKGAIKKSFKDLDGRTMTEVTQLIKDAQHAMDSNKFPAARDKLQVAKELNPKNFKIYDMLAESYEKTGNTEKASDIRAEVQVLRDAATQGIND